MPFPLYSSNCINLKPIELISQLMFKRTPATSKSDKHDRDKYSDQFDILNQCIYIPYDDKMILRGKIKQKDQQALAILEQYRRNRVLSELQVNFRKYVKAIKEKADDQELEDRHKRKKSLQTRVYSQQSLPKSTKDSKKESPQRPQSKNKVIKIDIHQLRKTITKNTPKLCLNSTKSNPKDSLQTKPFKSTRYQQDCQINRKIILATIKDSQRQQVNYYELYTQPHLQSLEHSSEKVKQMGKSPKNTLLDDAFFREEISSLMKSKMGRRKSSTPSQIPQYKPFSTVQTGKSPSDEQNKQNIDYLNRLQSRQTPFFTDRPSTTKHQISQKKEQTTRESVDPKFGQFYKKIKEIMKGHFK